MEKGGIAEFVDCLGSATDNCECTMTVNGVECDLTPIVIAVKHTCAIRHHSGRRYEGRRIVSFRAQSPHGSR